MSILSKRNTYSWRKIIRKKKKKNVCEKTTQSYTPLRKRKKFVLFAVLLQVHFNINPTFNWFTIHVPETEQIHVQRYLMNYHPMYYLGEWLLKIWVWRKTEEVFRYFISAQVSKTCIPVKSCIYKVYFAGTD